MGQTCRSLKGTYISVLTSGYDANIFCFKMLNKIFLDICRPSLRTTLAPKSPNDVIKGRGNEFSYRYCYDQQLCFLMHYQIFTGFFIYIVRITTGVTCVLSDKISGLNSSAVRALVRYASGSWFESRLRLHFSPPVALLLIFKIQRFNILGPALNILFMDKH